MKLPPFTLVHMSNAGPAIGSTPALNRRLTGASKKLVNTLAASVESGSLGTSALSKVAREFQRQESVESVGIWDLGAWVGQLPRIIEAMNAAQPAIVIFEVQAAAPAGLTSRKDRIARWGEHVLGRKLRPPERRELGDAIVDTDFFPLAESVRRDLGIDYLIGLTDECIASEITDQDGHTIHSDFFSLAKGRLGLVSTRGLRDYALAAGRPYESAVAFVFLSAVFSVMNPKLQCHDDTGCVMDYNYERGEIVRGLRSPMLDEQCTRAMKPGYRDMAQALMATLQRYRGSQLNR